MEKEEKQKVQRGDLIHLDYELWLVDDNLLFDTTDKELADKHEITDENAVYQPRPLIVDEGKAVQGLYKSLLNAEVGKDYEIEVNPEEGLGSRDPKLVEWHMMNEIRRQRLEPVVGKEITIKSKDGRERTGIVAMVSPRRVRVDYNSPLAGKTLRYKYKVVDKAAIEEEKVATILEINFGRKDEFEIKTHEDVVEIKLPDVCKYDQLWFMAKYKIVNDLREYAGFNKIRFVEEYVKKEEEGKEAEVVKEQEEREEGKEEGMEKEDLEKKEETEEKVKGGEHQDFKVGEEEQKELGEETEDKGEKVEKKGE